VIITQCQDFKFESNRNVLVGLLLTVIGLHCTAFYEVIRDFRSCTGRRRSLSFHDVNMTFFNSWLIVLYLCIDSCQHLIDKQYIASSSSLRSGHSSRT